jgi:transposase
MTLHVTSTQTAVCCPVCAAPAARIHRRDTRTLADLPRATYRVRLQLQVRKWFCLNPACGRRIFTERLPTVAAPWARRTLRLVQRLVALGLALGGRAGVRLSHAWDITVSRHTLLRGLRRHPEPALPTPRVLGVDDFALRTRQAYGTVLIDLERRQPVALLLDRTAAVVAQWLQAHPGVQVITRDRWCASAEGARHGAPTATQVADRFHVLQKLREALEQVFVTPRHSLAAVHAMQRQQPGSLPGGALAVPVPPHDRPRPEQPRAAPHQARRQAWPQQVWTLPHQGRTARAMAQHLGLDRRTGPQDRRRATWAGRLRRSDLGTRVLHPYTPYLLERWNAGCYTATPLFRERSTRGDTGSDDRVAASARRLRQAPGLRPGPRGPRQPLPPVAEPAGRPLTPRRATWMVPRRPAQRSAAETPPRAQLCAQSPEVAEAGALAQDFLSLVRQRQPEARDPWLHRAMASSLDALRRFATGLAEDEAAAKAGVTLPWSSGPVEGHIHRVNMLKRQLFGRAPLDLLSRRFVRASPGGQAQAPGPREMPCAPAEPVAA